MNLEARRITALDKICRKINSANGKISFSSFPIVKINSCRCNVLIKATDAYKDESGWVHIVGVTDEFCYVKIDSFTDHVSTECLETLAEADVL